MQTAGGAVFKTKLFTLPRIWQQIQVSNLTVPEPCYTVYRLKGQPALVDRDCTVYSSSR